MTDVPGSDDVARDEADTRAVLERAARHPDPWFAALAAAQLDLPQASNDADVELIARLERQAATGAYDPPPAIVEELDIPGPHGPVRVRVYGPRTAAQERPWLVWCHGGAFVGGDLDMPEADASAREIVARANAVVVSVDYRLAVEGIHFPIPHDDVHAAFRWTAQQAGPWGLRGEGVIGGGSAGANLAAGAALRLSHEGRPPAGVLLLYPVVHPILPPASEELECKLAKLSPAHTFPPRIMQAVVENYLGAPHTDASAYAMPGFANVDGFPPTMLINCEYDGLRASGEAFAVALKRACVPVTELLATDVLHGHINSPWLPQAQQSFADMAAWVTACSTRTSSAS
jgi:acetyl esterase/lipase